ncbi:hypothetical protein ASG52_01875 [Methylobacterium sp. Leaf456]|uniref:hypothetical protein n=1 Tax=Methylobacterium sp. Leaf456 TaxID=1736382 RepID=UPI0006F7512D|nr:hypothetical protein [Methylobacterium sp. Leaf456]KQT61654.1 hypothetical protein ASG52_01875 [Methylobacterium sp. Leaf456]
MIDTVNLLPPGFGPRANPLLFGVSEGLMHLFPLPTADHPAVVASEPSVEPAPAPAPLAAEA